MYETKQPLFGTFRAQIALESLGHQQARKLVSRGVVRLNPGTWDAISLKGTVYEFVKNVGVGAAFIAGISGLVGLLQRFTKWKASKTGLASNSTSTDGAEVANTNNTVIMTAPIDYQALPSSTESGLSR